jgi:hypothetical protein
MRYSYAWDVAPHLIGNWWRYSGTYWSFSGIVGEEKPERDGFIVVHEEPVEDVHMALPVKIGRGPVPPAGWRVVVKWRFRRDDSGFGGYLDTTASRFHPASVAGLAVGAMGVFIFLVALRDWLRRRRPAG